MFLHHYIYTLFSLDIEFVYKNIVVQTEEQQIVYEYILDRDMLHMNSKNSNICNAYFSRATQSFERFVISFS